MATELTQRLGDERVYPKPAVPPQCPSGAENAPFHAFPDAFIELDEAGLVIGWNSAAEAWSLSVDPMIALRYE